MPYGHASILLLGEGSEATEPYNKYDKIRPHSIRSLQFDQKVRPLSFRPENFGVGGNRSKERDRKSELVLRSTYQIFWMGSKQLGSKFLKRSQICSHTPSALNAGAKRSGATCHYGHASMLLLGEGSEATEPYNKYDKIRPHSIRSQQFDQKVRPLSFRPEKFDLFTATQNFDLFTATWKFHCSRINNPVLPRPPNEKCIHCLIISDTSHFYDTWQFDENWLRDNLPNNSRHFVLHVRQIGFRQIVFRQIVPYPVFVPAKRLKSPPNMGSYTVYGRSPSPSQRPASTTIASRSPFPLGLCSCSTSLSKMGT